MATSSLTIYIHENKPISTLPLCQHKEEAIWRAKPSMRFSNILVTIKHNIMISENMMKEQIESWRTYWTDVTVMTSDAEGTTMVMRMERNSRWQRWWYAAALWKASRDEDLKQSCGALPRNLICLHRCRITRTSGFGDLFSCSPIQAGARDGVDCGGKNPSPNIYISGRGRWVAYIEEPTTSRCDRDVHRLDFHILHQVTKK